MQQLIDYLIKLSGTIILVYAFYRVVLCRLTFYRWNRWYLVGYSFAAFFIPLVNINPFLENAKLTDKALMQWVPVISTDTFVANSRVNNAASWNPLTILIVVLVAGILFLVARLIIRCISIVRIRYSSSLISPGPVKIYQVNDDVTPFSFGNSIFINRHKHNDEELGDIIRHEFIHVKQNHTIDIMFAEVFCILNWYNPFAWMIRSAIRQNLEFIADDQVLQNGVDKKKYQYLLLKVVGSQHSGITSHFNFTSLKNRIAMMNKLRSTKIHLVKFLFILPLLTIILLAFRTGRKALPVAEPIFSHAAGSETPVSDVVVDTVPAPVKPAKPAPPQLVRPNDKGFIIVVTNDDGESVVIIRNKDSKFVKAVSLAEWKKDQEKFESEYGKISFLPPAGNAVPEAPAAPERPVLPENVSSIHVKDNSITIGLKEMEKSKSMI